MSKGSRWRRDWAPPPAEPCTGVRRVLHVEKQPGRTAARRKLTRALLVVFPGLFTVLAAHRERQRAQGLLADLLTAVEAVALSALPEPPQRVVDLFQRLGLHLHERELEIFLNVGFSALNGVQHFVELAA